MLLAFVLYSGRPRALVLHLKLMCTAIFWRTGCLHCVQYLVLPVISLLFRYLWSSTYHWHRCIRCVWPNIKLIHRESSRYVFLKQAREHLNGYVLVKTVSTADWALNVNEKQLCVFIRSTVQWRTCNFEHCFVDASWFLSSLYPNGLRPRAVVGIAKGSDDETTIRAP